MLGSTGFGHWWSCGTRTSKTIPQCAFWVSEKTVILSTETELRGDKGCGTPKCVCLVVSWQCGAGARKTWRRKPKGLVLSRYLVSLWICHGWHLSPWNYPLGFPDNTLSLFSSFLYANSNLGSKSSSAATCPTIICTELQPPSFSHSTFCPGKVCLPVAYLPLHAEDSWRRQGSGSTDSEISPGSNPSSLLDTSCWTSHVSWSSSCITCGESVVKRI